MIFEFLNHVRVRWRSWSDAPPAANEPAAGTHLTLAHASENAEGEPWRPDEQREIDTLLLTHPACWF